MKNGEFNLWKSTTIGCVLAGFVFAIDAGFRLSKAELRAEAAERDLHYLRELVKKHSFGEHRFS